MLFNKPKIALFNLNSYIEVNTKTKDNEAIDEIKEIKSSLIKNNFEIIETSTRWPRDKFIYDEDFLITREDYDKLGEGGLIIQGKNFVLLSNALNNQEYISKIKENNFFKNKTIYFIDPMKINNTYIHSGMHIDLTIGSIPSLDLLTVDENHYNQQRNLFKMLERNHGVSIIPIEIKSSEKKLYFNNYLVVEDEIPYVLTDPNATYLNSILEQFNLNLDHIGISMVGNPILDGSIRCLTNIIKTDEAIQYLNDYEILLQRANMLKIHTGIDPNYKSLLDSIRNSRKQN
jgi:hypothetical protein